MNILHIAENYTSGGFETHLRTLSQSLNKEHESFFAFSNFEPVMKNPFSDKVATGFHFNLDVSIKDFISDVEELLSLINKNRIDIIHAHPFHSLIPSFFAASISQKPLVITFHGDSSFNFIWTPVQSILFYQCLDMGIGHVFAVNSNVLKYLNDNNFKSTSSLMLNPIEIEVNIAQKERNNTSNDLAIVSRLDDDRSEGISKLLKKLPYLNFKNIYIFGTGSEEKELMRLTKELEIDDRVFFQGHKEDWLDFAKEKCLAVAGLGRVALEAVCHNIPVILIGKTSSPVGLINEDLFQSLSENNFIGDSLYLNINNADINHLIERLHDPSFIPIQNSNIFSDFDANNVCSAYIKTLQSQQSREITELMCIYNDLKTIEDQNLPFYYTNETFHLLRKYLERVTLNPLIKSYYILSNYFRKEIDIITSYHYSVLRSELKQVNNKLELLQKKQENIFSKILRKLGLKSTK